MNKIINKIIKQYRKDEVFYFSNSKDQEKWIIDKIKQALEQHYKMIRPQPPYKIKIKAFDVNEDRNDGFIQALDQLDINHTKI
jgi:hypothetical protein